MNTRIPRILTMLLALTVGLVGLTAPAHADDTLTGTSPSATFSVAPGHSATWQFDVTNTTNTTTDVTLDITDVTGDLFAGETPAVVSLTSAGRTLADEARAADFTGSRFVLDAVQPGQTVSFEGTVLLPRTASDEYRDTEGTVHWRFSHLVDDADDQTTGPVSPPKQWLPGTGADVAPWVVALALALIGLGLWPLLARRRTNDDEEEAAVS